MKLATLFFFALLIYAHQVCGLSTSLEQSLSVFREGEFGSLGYALFCVIGLIGVLYTFSLNRFGEPGQASNTLGFGVLLLIVSATPIGWSLHDSSAIVLLVSIYAYFAILLHRSSRRLMLLHLSVPILLAGVIGFQSYGIWQKGLISYFVVAAMVHHHVVTRGAQAPAAADPRELGHSSRRATELGR